MKKELPATCLALALLLSACGGSKDVASSPSPVDTATTSSSSPSPAATTSPVPETTPPASPTSAEPTAPAKSDTPLADSPVAPGTNCGSPAGQEDFSLYVSGGPVSCQEALSVMNEYNQVDLSTTEGVYGQAIVQGYECYTNTSVRYRIDSLARFCTNKSTGGYLELRPANLRIIPGPVEKAANYEVFLKGTSGDRPLHFYPAGDTNKTGSTVHCSIGEIQVQCSAFNGQSLNTVTMTADGLPQVEQLQGPPQAPGFEAQEAKPLDIGTTLTGYGISCQPQGPQNIRCINPVAGFTISFDGVTTE